MITVIMGIAWVDRLMEHALTTLETAPTVSGLTDIQGTIAQIQLGYGIMLLFSIVSVYLMLVRPF